MATFRAARVHILCGSSWKQGLARDSAWRAPCQNLGPRIEHRVVCPFGLRDAPSGAMSVRALSSDPALRGKRVDAMVTVWHFKNAGSRSSALIRIYRFLWEQLRAVGSSIVDMVHVPSSQFVLED